VGYTGQQLSPPVKRLRRGWRNSMAEPKRRKKGLGTVRALPSGRWQARIWVGDKQVSAPATFETKMDATAWLARASREQKKGVFVPPVKAAVAAPLTFKEYADRWLLERPLKPRTRQEYRGLLDRHLIPELGDERIASLTPPIIRSWHARCAKGHPATRVKAYSLLRTILQQAEDDELLTRNPAKIKGAGTPPAAVENPIPSPAQVDALMAAMPEDMRPMVVLASWGGLRLGEVLGLRGEDVALPRIHVRQSAVAVKGGATIGTPKSRAGTRVVVLPPHVLPALTPLEGRTGLLWPSKADPARPMATPVFYKAWYTARSEAGLPDLKFHTLRHAGATWAAQAGASVGELMGRLGHTSPSMAMRYQHSTRDDELAARISAHFA
jgi:integrase